MHDSRHAVDQQDEVRSPGAQAPGGAGPASDERASGPAERPSAPGAEQGAVASAEGAGSSPDGAPAGTGEEEASVKGDLDELVRTAAQRDEYLALAQRTQADFENYRKRVAREAASAQERGTASLVRELLPALDNLDRALEAAAEDDPLLQGVRLVRAELSSALGRCGIESYTPRGEVFDPSFHEAVATAEQPAQGGSPSGTVVEVYQLGYRLGENVIRPARVVVAA
jgi:molecular chaperone GrpE